MCTWITKVQWRIWKLANQLDYAAAFRDPGADAKIADVILNRPDAPVSTRIALGSGMRKKKWLVQHPIAASHPPILRLLYLLDVSQPAAINRFYPCGRDVG